MKKSVYVLMSLIAAVFVVISVHTSHSGTKSGYSALAMDPSDARIFCVNDGQEGVDVFDIKTRTVTNTILRDKDISAIAVDGSGNAIAIWPQSNATTDHMYTKNYINGSGWAGPTSVGTNANSITGHRIILDTSDNAIAVWGQSNGVKYNLWTNQFE